MVRASNSAAIRQGDKNARIVSKTVNSVSTTPPKTYGGRISFLRGTKKQITTRLRNEQTRLRTKEAEYKAKGMSGKKETKSKYRKKAKTYTERAYKVKKALETLDERNLQDTTYRANVYMAVKGSKDYDRAKRLAAYSFEERQQRGERIAAQKSRDKKISAQSGLTQEEINRMNPQAFNAVRAEYESGNLRRAGTQPPTRKGTKAYSATIEGKKYVGTEAFINKKIKQTEDKFYTERYAEAEGLTAQGYNASDFFPKKQSPTNNILTPTSYSLQTLSQTPKGKRRKLTSEEIKQFGFERQAEIISQEENTFFTSKGMKNIQQFSNQITQPNFKGKVGDPIVKESLKSYDQRSFAGQTTETLVSGAISVPFSTYGVLKYGAKKSILGAKIALNGGAKEVSKELFISAPKRMEETSFSFLPFGTPITPEGAATALTIGAGTAILGYGIKASNIAPPRTTGATGKINIKGTGGSATITSSNLIPTPKISTVTKISYAERTKGLFPRKVDTTIRLSNTGSVKTQIIGKNTYTQVLKGKNTLVTKTTGGKFLNQATIKNIGGGKEGIVFSLTRSTTKNKITNFADRPNQLLSRTTLRNEFDVSGRLSGKRITGVYDTSGVGEVKVFASPAKGVLIENVFEKNLITGKKGLASNFQDETFLPIKLTKGQKGDSFPKIYSKSQQKSGGLRIGDDGTIYSRVTTRTRIAELNIKLKSKVQESGLGQAAKEPYIIDAISGFARNKKGSSILKPRFVKGGKTGRFAVTKEVLKPRRPEIINVGRPTIKGTGFKGGFRRISSPRSASIVAPIIAFNPKQKINTIPKTFTRNINRSVQIPKNDFSTYIDFRTGTRLTPIQDTIINTTPRTSTTTLFSPFTPTPTRPRTPNYKPPFAGDPFIPMGIPFGFGFGGDNGRKKGSSYTSKRKFGYSADLPSIDLKIFGKTKTPKGGFTGLEPRRLRI